MEDNLQKFLFLGVMISVVMFSSRNSLYKQRATAVFEGASLARLDPPLFVLQSPEVAEPKQEILPQAVEQQGSVESQDGLVARAFYKHKDDPPPEINVQAALVGDVQNGEVFWSRNPDKRWPLASITKLMTAAVISRNMPLNQSTTFTASDFRIESLEQNASSSRFNMSSSSRFTIGDLRKAMLLVSSNESAEAAARVYGRGDFLAKMNANVREWGLTNTFFDDPTGLSSSNQSTAADLLKLAGFIYNRYPEIFRITKIPLVSILDLNSGKKILIKNINNFAGTADFLGGKTGYTDEASGNLLSVFSYRGRPIVIIVLGTEDRFHDTEKLLNWFKNNFK